MCKANCWGAYPETVRGEQRAEIRACTWAKTVSWFQGLECCHLGVVVTLPDWNSCYRVLYEGSLSR